MAYTCLLLIEIVGSIKEQPGGEHLGGHKTKECMHMFNIHTNTSVSVNACTRTYDNIPVSMPLFTLPNDNFLCQ